MFHAIEYQESNGQVSLTRVIWLDDVRELPELQMLPISTEIAARAGSFGSEVDGDPINRLIIAALLTKAKLVRPIRIYVLHR